VATIRYPGAVSRFEALDAGTSWIRTPGVARFGSRSTGSCAAADATQASKTTASLQLAKTRDKTRPRVTAQLIFMIAATEGTPFVSRRKSM